MNGAEDAEGSRFSIWPYLAFSIVFVVVVIICGRLHPDDSGHGTHVQLGLPPCGFLEMTGVPCPSCGLTTSLAWLGSGNVAQSLITQPFGSVLMLTAGVLFALVPVAIYKKEPMGRVVQRPWFEGLQAILLVLFLSSWVYKIIVMAWL